LDRLSVRYGEFLSHQLEADRKAKRKDERRLIDRMTCGGKESGRESGKRGVPDGGQKGTSTGSVTLSRSANGSGATQHDGSTSGVASGINNAITNDPNVVGEIQSSGSRGESDNVNEICGSRSHRGGKSRSDSGGRSAEMRSLSLEVASGISVEAGSEQAVSEHGSSVRSHSDIVEPDSQDGNDDVNHEDVLCKEEIQEEKNDVHETADQTVEESNFEEPDQLNVIDDNGSIGHKEESDQERTHEAAAMEAMQAAPISATRGEEVTVVATETVTECKKAEVKVEPAAEAAKKKPEKKVKQKNKKLTLREQRAAAMRESGSDDSSSTSSSPTGEQNDSLNETAAPVAKQRNERVIASPILKATNKTPAKAGPKQPTSAGGQHSCKKTAQGTPSFKSPESFKTPEAKHMNHFKTPQKNYAGKGVPSPQRFTGFVAPSSSKRFSPACAKFLNDFFDRSPNSPTTVSKLSTSKWSAQKKNGPGKVTAENLECLGKSQKVIDWEKEKRQEKADEKHEKYKQNKRQRLLDMEEATRERIQRNIEQKQKAAERIARKRNKLREKYIRHRQWREWEWKENLAMKGGGKGDKKQYHFTTTLARIPESWEKEALHQDLRRWGKWKESERHSFFKEYYEKQIRELSATADNFEGVALNAFLGHYGVQIDTTDVRWKISAGNASKLEYTEEKYLQDRKVYGKEYAEERDSSGFFETVKNYGWPGGWTVWTWGAGDWGVGDTNSSNSSGALVGDNSGPDSGGFNMDTNRLTNSDDNTDYNSGSKCSSNTEDPTRRWANGALRDDFLMWRLNRDGLEYQRWVQKRQNAKHIKQCHLEEKMRVEKIVQKRRREERKHQKRLNFKNTLTKKEMTAQRKKESERAMRKAGGLSPCEDDSSDESDDFDSGEELMLCWDDNEQNLNYLQNHDDTLSGTPSTMDIESTACSRTEMNSEARMQEVSDHDKQE
jgi:hypothetical protein